MMTAKKRDFWLSVLLIFGGGVLAFGLIAFAITTEILKFLALWKWIFS